MTKAGADSLIADIRIYWDRQSDILKGSGMIVPFTERVVLGLRSLGYCFGPATHLYVTPQANSQGNDCITFKAGVEHWMLYANIPVCENFGELDFSSRDRIIFQAVRDALLKLTPDKFNEINSVCDAAIIDGSEIRFLVKSRTIRNIGIVATINVADPGDKPIMRIEAFDKKTNVLLQQDEVALRHHTHAFKIVSNIKIVDDHIVLEPRISFTAGIELRHYSLPMKFEATWMKGSH